uniref:Uncharacterized protein n=1 Tax=Arundo donax TaxID=35708 RepID=A0A0A8ZW79_ARUDO
MVLARGYLTSTHPVHG